MSLSTKMPRPADAETTPTSVWGTPSRKTFVPTTSGLAAKRSRQYRSVRSATRGAPTRPSSGRKLRPMATGIVPLRGQVRRRANERRALRCIEACQRRGAVLKRSEVVDGRRTRRPVHEVGNGRAGNRHVASHPGPRLARRGSVDDTKMSRPVSATGSACQTLSTVLAMMVLTPIATASVSTMTPVAVGLRSSARVANRRSVIHMS